MENVEVRIEENFKLTLQKLSQQANLSYGTSQKIVKQNFDLIFYKIKFVKNCFFFINGEKKVTHYEWFNSTMNNNIFSYTGHVNKIYKLSEHKVLKIYMFRETLLHSLKVGI